MDIERGLRSTHRSGPFIANQVIAIPHPVAPKLHRTLCTTSASPTNSEQRDVARMRRPTRARGRFYRAKNVNTTLTDLPSLFGKTKDSTYTRDGRTPDTMDTCGHQGCSCHLYVSRSLTERQDSRYSLSWPRTDCSRRGRRTLERWNLCCAASSTRLRCTCQEQTP